MKSSQDLVEGALPLPPSSASDSFVDISRELTQFLLLKVFDQVITWGHKQWGGDSTAVEDRLSQGVQSVTGGENFFVAILKNGEIVAW